MIPVSLYISLPYYLFALLWSGIYSVLSYFKKGLEGSGDRLKDLDINYRTNMTTEEFECCENNYIVWSG
jgi:hypothetical protein